MEDKEKCVDWRALKDVIDNSSFCVFSVRLCGMHFTYTITWSTQHAYEVVTAEETEAREIKYFTQDPSTSSRPLFLTIIFSCLFK